MAIQKQLIHLNMKGGLDTKHDDFLVIPSKLTRADGVEFGDDDTVGILNGASAGPVFAGGALALRLAKYKSSLLANIQVGNNPPALVRYAVPGTSTQYDHIKNANTGGDAVVCPSEAVISDVASMPFPSATGRWMGFDGGDYRSCVRVDCGAYGTTVLYAQETTDGANSFIALTLVVDGKIKLAVNNAVSGESRINPRVIPLVGAGAGKFAVYYVKVVGGVYTPVVRVLDSTTSSLDSSSWAAESVLSSGGALAAGDNILSASAMMDSYPAIGSDVKHCIAFVSSLGNIVMFTLNSTTGLQAGTSGGFTTALAPSAAVKTLSLISVPNGTTNFIAIFTVGTASVRAFPMPIGGGAPAEVGIATVTGGGAGRIGRVTATDFGGQLVLFCDTFPGSAFASPPAPHNVVMHAAFVAYNMTVNSELDVLYGAFLYSRPVATNSRLYLSAIRTDTDGSTVFVLDVTQANFVVARLAYGECGNIAQNTPTGVWPYRIPTAFSDATKTLAFPLTTWTGNVQVVGGVNVTQLKLSQARVNLFSLATRMPGVELLPGTVLPGACPRVFDGATLTEAGFNWRPTITSVTVSAGSGGVGTGAVSFVATYAWTDHTGAWHESAPSDVYTPVAPFAAGDSYAITVAMLGLTDKTGVKILFYRTVPGGSTFFLDLAVLANSVAAISASTTVTLALGGHTDAALTTAGSELLPTTGGVLPNDPLPAHRHAAIFQNRLWMTGCGDGYDIYYTHPIDEGFGVEHSVLLHKRIPQGFGRGIGVAESYGKLVVVCENGVGFIYGTGPTRAGAQDGYSEIEFPVHDITNTWESPATVASTSDGVWFQSTNGLRLFRDSGIVRDEAGIEVGSEMDQYTRQEAGLSVHTFGPQLRFVGSATMYIYDLHWKQWSRADIASTDSVLVDGKHYFAYKDTVAIHKNPITSGEVLTGVTETGGPYPFFPVPLATIETAWIPMAGIQGFQRAFRLMLLFRQVSGLAKQFSFTVEAAYDYADFTEGPVSYDMSDGNYPTGATMLQIQHHFARQKCEAVKLRIAWHPLAQAGVSLPGLFRLVDLTLQVGVKPGYYKLPSSQRI